MNNIYIEYNQDNFKRIIEYINKLNICNHEISLKILFSEHTNLTKVYNYIKKNKYNKITYVIYNNNFTSEVIKLLSKKKSFVNVQFIINEKINENTHKFFVELSKINRSFEIYDYNNNLENFEFKNINILKNQKNKYEHRMLYVYCNNGNNCKTNSCLGKVLFINKCGNISFCPKYSKETCLGNINNINSFENIYDNEIFISYLEKMIQKRNNCKNTCPYFINCKGGCAIEDTCEDFKINFLKIKEKIKYIFDNNINLNNLTLSIKENILWMIVNNKEVIK